VGVSNSARLCVTRWLLQGLATHASILSAHALYGGSQCVCVVISAGCTEHALSEQVLTDMFSLIDRDHSGTVSAEEFIR
jgi:hypothetical protein